MKMKLLLTERALDDLAEIESYSIAQWGKKRAAQYLMEIETALSLIQEKPGLLKSNEPLHETLSFYRVNKHILVCDIQEKSILVLTVIHSSRDIPSRLFELQPTLHAEVELLRGRIAGKGKGRRK